MARGKPLTDVEKWAIKGMMESGLSIGKIATKMGRSDTLVRGYVDDDLSQLKQLIDEEEGNLPKDVAEAVFNKLVESGLEKIDAVSCINFVRSKLTEPANIGHVDYIVARCLKKTNIRAMFVTNAEGGRKGIAVMTKAASEQLDEVRKNRKASRNVDDHIFKQEHAIPKGLDE